MAILKAEVRDRRVELEKLPLVSVVGNRALHQSEARLESFMRRDGFQAQLLACQHKAILVLPELDGKIQKEAIEEKESMRNWLRRIRGAIGMGLTWGAVWSAAGLIPRWLLGLNPDAPFPIIFGALGFIAGITFSGVLVLTEGRRRFDQMSLPRFAGWGAVGGLLLSALFAKLASLGLGDILLIAPTFAAASAICASGSLALARRAVGRQLPDSHASAALRDQSGVGR